MNELQVVVKQEVGKINWNFEELKTALATEMKKYTGIVFDDDSIADAKKTVAYLRKLKESVEDRRKDVKKKCLEPYNEMEKQAKELTQLIDEPINTIAKQVKDYEEEQKKKKKEEILAYMAEVFAELPETVPMDGNLLMNYCRADNKTTANIKIPVASISESYGNATCTVKRNLAYFDGSLKMNGSRLLNSLNRKETI